MTGQVGYEEGVLLRRIMRCATCGSGLLMPHVGQGQFQLRCLKDPEHTTMTARKNTRMLVNPDGTLQEFDMTTQKPVATTELVRYQTDHGPLSLSVNQIRQYICPKATVEEAYIFLRLCQAQRLNPFLKEAYLIVYGSGENRKASMIVGRDAYIRRAEAHEQFGGFRAGIIAELADGNVEEIDGSFPPLGSKLLGGWSLTQRKDRAEPHRTTVSFAEYNTSQNLWVKMPATMIRKVAIVQGLREAFPTVYAGVDANVDIGDVDEALGEVLYDSQATPATPSAPAPTPSQPATPAPAPGTVRAPTQAASCEEHGNAPLHMHTGLKQMVHRLADNRFCNGKGQTWSPTGEAEAQQTPATGQPAPGPSTRPAPTEDDGLPPSVAQDEAELRAAVTAANFDTLEQFCQTNLRVPSLEAWRAQGKTIAQALTLVPGYRSRRERG